MLSQLISSASLRAAVALTTLVLTHLSHSTQQLRLRETMVLSYLWHLQWSEK